MGKTPIFGYPPEPALPVLILNWILETKPTMDARTGLEFHVSVFKNMAHEKKIKDF